MTVTDDVQLTRIIPGQGGIIGISVDSLIHPTRSLISGIVDAPVISRVIVILYIRQMTHPIQADEQIGSLIYVNPKIMRSPNRGCTGGFDITPNP